MDKRKYKKEIKKIKSLLGMLSISIVLLFIDILVINLTGPYFGNWFRKYVSFLMDNSVYPKRKCIFLACIMTVLAIIYYIKKL